MVTEAAPRIRALFHLTHVENIASIMRRGLVSHHEAYRTGLIRRDVSSDPVQAIRERKLDSVYGHPLHDYASLYFQPANPMLRQLLVFHQDVVVLGILPKVLDAPGTIFTDGSAACGDTRFFADPADLRRLRWDVLAAGDWTCVDDGKRLRCAEVLVRPLVSPHLIFSVVCSSAEQAGRVRAMTAQSRTVQSVTVQPDLFRFPGERG